MKIMTTSALTEKEKMLAGMVYSAADRQLLEELNAVKEVIHRYNGLSPADNAGRLDILKGLLGHIADEEIIINQPFYCDYESRSVWESVSLPISTSPCLTRRR